MGTGHRAVRFSQLQLELVLLNSEREQHGS